MPELTVPPVLAAFAEFLKAYGVDEPPSTTDVILDGKGRPLHWWYLSGGRERRGSSTLTKWSCGCQSVRTGRREFYACCTRCGKTFEKAEAQEKRPPKVQGRFDLAGSATTQEEADLQPRPTP